MGAISDTAFMVKSNILKKQLVFADEEDVVRSEEGEIIPFTNILDKGYRIVRICYKHGRQTRLHQTFAKSDSKFSSEQMLLSATVAADRSGNERCVNRCKLAGYIKRGLNPHGCPKRMNNVWLAWSFQTNFMLDSVIVVP